MSATPSSLEYTCQSVNLFSSRQLAGVSSSNDHEEVGQLEQVESHFEDTIVQWVIKALYTIFLLRSPKINGSSSRIKNTHTDTDIDGGNDHDEDIEERLESRPQPTLCVK